ncbi:hypothetical protein PIB30_025140 [Stylosanthes scabra]|uniref:Uncharacterized protein n=1 Tax=Stylosanthes scabra TaxID=79078 RepID=A0ABU6XA43_9FABA|nr:hypothetical protein [Stylosanthes scabra]
MFEELWRTPSQGQVFTRTHTMTRRKRIMANRLTSKLYDDEIKRLEEERAELIAAGCPEPARDYDVIWVWVVGGRKRGRVNGRGKVLSRLSHWSTILMTFLLLLGQFICASMLLFSIGSSHSRQNNTDRRLRLCVSSMRLLSRAGSTASSVGMPSLMPPPLPPPPPLQHGLASATEQLTPDADKSLHDDPDYV